LRVVATFCREPFEHQRFYEGSRNAVKARVDVTVRQTLFALVVNLTTAVGIALVLGFGAYHVLEGTLTVGQMLIVMAYVHAVYSPLEQISHTLATIQEQFIFLAMSLDLLDAVPDIQEPADAVTLDRIEGSVVFENVTFTYPGREFTLRDVSFSIPAGSSVALVGRTGAGKTTLVSLISRFLDPASGRVLVDGHDVRTLSLHSLRSQVSMVPQEPMLFSGSVKENILYGRADATDEEVVEAAKAANADDFIENLPAGYETQLGSDTGTHLSGGERQRICVARAFLKNAPILILDEPTSSIDSKTESVILDALERLMEGRTTFMIAHRLSTVRHCDRLLVMEGGQLVEQGTHDDLLARRGTYHQLHEMQMQQRNRRLQARRIFKQEDEVALSASTVDPVVTSIDSARAARAARLQTPAERPDSSSLQEAVARLDDSIVRLVEQQRPRRHDDGTGHRVGEESS
jgi:ABC-type multidrug transport system fused ATPase/permease subunit